MNNKSLKRQKYSTKVKEDIYQIVLPTSFPVGPVNVYLIEGDLLTLVDTGPKTDEAWEILIKGIEETGYQLKDIQQILITHHHVDHSGLLERIRKISGAQTLGHPLLVPHLQFDNKFLEYRNRFFANLYTECGVPKEYHNHYAEEQELIQTLVEPSQVDIKLGHRQQVPGLKEWEVLYTPGHSQDHLSIFRKRDGVFLGGDHIIEHISSNALIEPPIDPANKANERPMTLVQYRTALEMCADEEIQIVFSGHGVPVLNHRELIHERLKSNWRRTEKIRKLLKEGPKTVFEITGLLFPNIFERELNLTISETLGHLDLLKLVYQVEVQENQGVSYYSIKNY
ncbi:MBL fold metallo-hydrolase [Alkalihalobacterium alkalinitrilicum]|uniref:MBL fold metallo-hydrolase n=1 Tax=Alkalihalobacterium alkalinitrilicum TaxID=427920 RepID=UPI000995CE05|nr:MBL fold metallo-hydrolase [Alkalihalobacterium alkalinitrilicum]